MCPDQQLLSIYMDGELPSPWKEKMESHLSECSGCREKFESFKHLQELFRKNSEPSGHVSQGLVLSEQELMEASKERVWRKLETRSNRTLYYTKRNLRSAGNLWKRRLSIPLPAAAAAAIIIALVTAAWFRGGPAGNNAVASHKVESGDRNSFVISAEEEVSGIIPTGNISDVLQYLSSNGKEIIILQLPESSNFSRAGEPAIINAADYTPGDK